MLSNIGASTPMVDQETQFPPLPSTNQQADNNPNTESPSKKLNFVSTLQPKHSLAKNHPNIIPIPRKQVEYVEDITVIQWTKEEVNRMDKIEILQYTVIGKFSYDWPAIEELRKNILKQCGIKGNCQIGVLQNRHVLIKCELLEDFVNLMSKSAYYIIDKD